MIETIYREHKIVYDENSEVWRTEVAERPRSSQNLKSCKDEIDKFLNASDKIKKKFDKFEAIRLIDYGVPFVTVTVTSITDDNTLWIINKSGERRKLSGYELNSLFVVSDANNAIIESIKAKRKEIEEKEKEETKLEESLERVNVKNIFNQINN